MSTKNTNTTGKATVTNVKVADSKVTSKVDTTAVVAAVSKLADVTESGPKEAVVCNINGINVANNCHIEMAANPKRAGSKAHMRYEAYSKSTTIGEYLESGGLKADLRYDSEKGFLTLKEILVDGSIIDNPKLETSTAK